MQMTKLSKNQIFHLPMMLALVMMPFGIPSVARAQQSQQLEEVVVTAQKREESLQDAALAVSAYSSEQLENLGIRNTADLQGGAVPTMKVVPYPNSPTTLIIAMRGVGVADGGSVLTELPVGIYVDGVYLGRSQGLGADILDLERLEVLRGPQGTLYGRNSIGGALNFVTKDPRGEFALSQQFTAGADWDYVRSITKLDLPAVSLLGGDLSTRINYLFQERDGWVENAGSGSGEADYWGDDRDGVRLVLHWERDNIAWKYSFDDSETEVGQSWYQLHRSSDGVPQELNGGMRWGTVGLSIPSITDAVPGVRLEAWRTAAAESGSRQERTPYPIYNQPTTVDTEAHTFSFSWQLADNMEFKSITGYREISQDTNTAYAGAFGLANTGYPALGMIDQEQFSQEFQLLGDLMDGRLRYILGAYYFDEDIEEVQGHNRSAYVTITDVLGALPRGGAPAVAALAADPTQGAELMALATHLTMSAGVPTMPQITNLQVTQGAIFALGRSFFAYPLLDATDDPIVAANTGLLDPMVLARAAAISDPRAQTYQVGLTASAESLAFFGQAEYDLNDRITLTFGVRYSEDEREARRLWDVRGNARCTDPVANAATGICQAGVDANGAVQRKVDSDNLDVSFTFDYQLNDQSNAYVRYASGYKAGGIDRRSVRFVTYDDEQLESIELGYKSRFLDNSAQANIALFYSEYDDRQTTFTDPEGMVTDTLTSNSADTVELSGLEMELLWLPLPGLQLGLSYTYLDTDFPLQSVDLDGMNGIMDYTTPGGIMVQEQNLRFDVAQAPRHSGSFTLDYTFAPLSFGTLAVHFNWNSSAEFIFSPRLNRARDARDIANARVTLSDIKLGNGGEYGDLKVSLWVDNLTDEEYAAYAIDEINSGNITYAYGRPRSYGIDVTYNFE